jgi:hypothetical protein
MTERTWEIIKVQFCDHVDCEVALEAEIVFPADILPDQPPRLGAHRCSYGADCRLLDKPTCQWAGGNPGYDPYVE